MDHILFNKTKIALVFILDGITSYMSVQFEPRSSYLSEDIWPKVLLEMDLTSRYHSSTSVGKKNITKASNSTIVMQFLTCIKNKMHKSFLKPYSNTSLINHMGSGYKLHQTQMVCLHTCQQEHTSYSLEQ